MIAIGPVNLLRPEWLYALLALPLPWWWLRRRRADGAAWRRAVDPHLLPHLLVPGRTATHRIVAWLAAIAYVLLVVALAGPAWRQVEMPEWQSREPLAIAVDLSSATAATDMPPTRLAQMRARLTRLLQSPRSGPIALVAFADDAFTVAPLTDDAANVALFVDALEPSVMPVDGQSPARAIAQSRELIERAGFPRGRIVLVTDHADSASQRAARDARAAGITVSALGLGSASGANVRTPGGASIHVQLDEGSLRDLARSGGGEYARLALDGSDDAVFATGEGVARRAREGGRAWADEGFRLVPLVMLLALIVVARRPRAAALLLAVVLLPRPSLAADLFFRPDQRAWHNVDRGVEAYRRGKFDAAAADFAKADTADAHYNRGNALAKAGHLEEAVSAYDEALRRQRGMPDAVANRAAVLKALKQPPPKGGQQQQAGQKGGASSQSQQPRNCAPGDAACKGQSSSKTPSNGSPQKQNAASPPKPADATRQAQADAAQRQRMQQALQQAKANGEKTPEKSLTPQQRERRMSDEAALMRVPDEPGNLLREKFRLEHERRQLGGGR
ncbi:VWA domain-containing protein [Lysobacter sp. TY2-98]|uniref:vWA domain-containing protein n=1 Tax=Lysobacter sp. TY2-98 TaxID=2290922 RepID=UPI000E20AE8F|nr:VWA domain-containing protein [Lysobacter sp. TY2-98]AXK73506.1 VWA domain-containing protein [Lysobacter sp. TY2-98]